MPQNRSIDQLSNEMLRDLAEAQPPCITIVVQTGGNLRARALDAVRTVRKELETGYPGEDADALLAPLEAVANRPEPNIRPAETLVLLRSRNHFHEFRTRQNLTERIVVNDEFHFRSLLTMLKTRKDFYLLALSQNHTRMLHCTDADVREVSLPTGTPASLDESKQTEKPDHVLDSRITAGPSMGSSKGVMFGTSSDRDISNEYLLHFFRALNRGVNEILRETGAPLVVAGVERDLALYRTVNSYTCTVEPGVQGAPDGMKGGEMHKRALDSLDAQPYGPVRKALEGFEKSAGIGRASNKAQEIVRAAYEGRISFLFLQESAEYRGTFDEMRRRVKRHDDGINPMRDLLNEAVVKTIASGGEVMVLPAKDMPNGVPACAVFRYPAPELQAEMRQTVSGSPVPI